MAPRPCNLRQFTHFHSSFLVSPVSFLSPLRVRAPAEAHVVTLWSLGGVSPAIQAFVAGGGLCDCWRSAGHGSPVAMGARQAGRSMHKVSVRSAAKESKLWLKSRERSPVVTPPWSRSANSYSYCHIVLVNPVEIMVVELSKRFIPQSRSATIPKTSLGQKWKGSYPSEPKSRWSMIRRTRRNQMHHVDRSLIGNLFMVQINYVTRNMHVFLFFDVGCHINERVQNAYTIFTFDEFLTAIVTVNKRATPSRSARILEIPQSIAALDRREARS
ncbi:hypothetical protein BJV77DRAFT_794844 [Russula vinacea]|nr:hypothetical protein BJV77DRAFT_794844 [Russula vinacea]